MRRRSVLTLVEILVVTAIIAALSALLLPAFARAKEAGQKAESLSNLKQIAAALILYAQDNEGRIAASAWHAGGWLAEIGLVRAGRATVRDPRYEPTDPHLYPEATGYAFNGCLQEFEWRPRLDLVPSNVVLAATAADTMWSGVDRSFAPTTALGMPDAMHGTRSSQGGEQPRLLSLGQWGSRRYRGGGLYVFVDGHAQWQVERSFRVPISAHPCHGRTHDQFSAPPGAPTFETESP